MKRRSFVRLSAVGLLVPLVGCQIAPEPHPSIGQPLSLSFIHDSATIHDLGMQYRSLRPGEDNRRRLNRLILSDQELSIEDPADSIQLLDFLSQKIKADYQLEETILLDGWVLSATEARQCALYSMTQ
jgi:hypothetical protein